MIQGGAGGRPPGPIIGQVRYAGAVILPNYHRRPASLVSLACGPLLLARGDPLPRPGASGSSFPQAEPTPERRANGDVGRTVTYGQTVAPPPAPPPPTLPPREKKKLPPRPRRLPCTSPVVRRPLGTYCLPVCNTATANYCVGHTLLPASAIFTQKDASFVATTTGRVDGCPTSTD